MTEEDPTELESKIRELEQRVAELDQYNLDLEREIARRGVKLNCANIALSRAKIAFDEQARHREEAVQDIAHDLRTPLTAIKGAAQNVLDGIAGPIDGGVKTYVEIIQNQSVRLIGVVNWLLQAIRITSEPRTLDPVRQDLRGLVAEVTTGLKPLADERGIALQVTGSPAWGCLDGMKVRLVLDNIVGNAIKFTDSGGEVRVSVESDEQNLRVVVADTGIGMDEEALEKVFHRYYRAHPDREGSGLGLLIARELARLHGGNITLESELGKGTTFCIELPRDQPDAALPTRATA